MAEEGFADRFEAMDIPYKHSALEWRQRHVLSMLDRMTKLLQTRTW